MIQADDADGIRWTALLTTWFTGILGDSHVWTLYCAESPGGDRYVVGYDPSNAEGDDPIDERPLRKRHSRVVELDARDVERLLRKGTAPIPLFGFEDYWGLDGDSRGCAIHFIMGGAELRWWCDGPEEWRPFTRWVERMQRRFHRALYPGEPDVPDVSVV